MPKFPKPFFRTGRGWYVQLRKEQIKLADGPKSSDTEDAALKRYHELMVERGREGPANSATPSAPTGLTVVEVFDKFLAWSQKHRATRTYEWYHDHIQSFMNHAGRDVVTSPHPELKPPGFLQAWRSFGSCAETGQGQEGQEGCLKCRVGRGNARPLWPPAG